MRVSGMMQAKYTTLTHFSQRYPVSQKEEEGTLVAGQEHVECGSVSAYAVTFDFLSFCFPSQAAVLAPTTHSLAALMADVSRGTSQKYCNTKL